MIPPSGKWFVQPPPWAVLDFDNPILKDVQHVASGSAPFLNRGRYNDSFRTSATPPVPVRQPTGISYNLTGSTGYLATNAGGWVNAKTDWTVYVLGIPRSVSVVSAIATIAEAPGSGTRDRSIQINSVGKVIGGGYDTANRQVISTSSLTANTPASAAVRGTSSALSVFVNGVNDATPVTMTAAGFGSYTSPEVIFGYGGSAAGFAATLASQFDLSLGIYWSRALTDAELLSLHEFPWQVFKSPKRIFVPEVVSGTTNDLLADNLQSTSSVSTPTLGQTHGLLANDLQTTSSLSTPTVGQVHVLLADNLQSASSLSTPSISQTHVLLADNLQSVSTLSTPSTGGTLNALLANDLQSVSTLSIPVLRQKKQINYAASATIGSLSAITFYHNGGKWYGY
jgi:hypothetical protein